MRAHVEEEISAELIDKLEHHVGYVESRNNLCLLSETHKLPIFYRVLWDADILFGVAHFQAYRGSMLLCFFSTLIHLLWKLFVLKHCLHALEEVYGGDSYENWLNDVNAAQNEPMVAEVISFACQGVLAWDEWEAT